MSYPIQAWQQRRRHPPLWPVAVIVVLGLGIWGFADLQPATPLGPPPPRLSLIDVIYRAIRLFALEFDLPPSAKAPWQLWVAAFAAPALTVRGIARLFRDQLNGVLTQYLVTPRLVIFGANERSVALLTSSPRPGRWRDAIVVVDPDPLALRTISARRVWTVRGPGTTAASLRRAAVHRAANVVVVRGDNSVNSAVTTAVLALEPTPSLDLFVEVEEAGLARTLEQGGHRAGVETVPFSAPGLGAASVLDQLDIPASLLLAPDSDGSAPAFALFGTGGLVDAFVLEFHRRRQVQLLEEHGSAGRAPRLLLLGPDARERQRSLNGMIGTDLQSLDLESLDVQLDQVVELDIDTARHLSRNRPLRCTFVLGPDDLVVGGIAITLARHLGPGTPLVLVTQSGATPFGDEIARQTRESATLAEVQLLRVPERAYRLTTLQGQRVADRLARALLEGQTPGRSWEALPSADRETRRASALSHLETAGTSIPLGRSAFVAPAPPELRLLQALGFDEPTALARAGLRADFQSINVLLPVSRRLLADDDEMTFSAWCEVARLHPDVTGLTEVTGQATEPEPASTARDVMTLLAIKRELLTTRPSGLEPPTAMVIGGPASEPERELLLPTLEQFRRHGQLRFIGSPPATQEDLRTRGALVQGPAGASIREQALAAWSDLARIHPAGRVRVLALPGAADELVLLSRAMGAVTGRFALPAATGSQGLLNGADGIIPLPRDRMTVRSFLWPGIWPVRLAQFREPLAAEFHRRYVERQQARKSPGDPALAPWAALSPWLQRSNLQLVDDIPAKLALLGLRLADRERAGGVDLMPLVRDHADELAEFEHGRFTAERLLSGWTAGVRDPARFMSPYLQPWSELDYLARDFDREAVLDIPAVLARFELAVEFRTDQ